MKQNAFHSYNSGALAQGCKACVQGKKSVIFITGLCPRRCYYCPLSDHKKWKDVQYANERPVSTTEEIIQEVRTSKSTGCSFTGGDPLAVLPRTLKTMRALKAAFGSSFHIHLYTSLSLLNHKTLQALKDAGLDEIRTHPDLYDTKLWPRITLLKQYIPCAGIEIPLLPDAKKLTKELIETYKDAVDFINLNELEASPAIFDEFETRGFKPSAKHSYAVKSSKDFGLELLKSHPKHRLHLCTCKLKDGVQLPKRLARRATSVVLPYEYIDKEGLLIRVTIDAPLDAIKTVCKRHKVPAKLLGVMNGKVYLAPWVYYTLKEELPYKATLQKVYPSFDQTCVYEEVL